MPVVAGLPARPDEPLALKGSKGSVESSGISPKSKGGQSLQQVIPVGGRFLEQQEGAWPEKPFRLAAIRTVFQP